jgi:probable phosphoglycerate mutase
LADKLRVTGELQDCHALLCSPVRRAYQTAEILAGALPVGAVEHDCGLCEVHPGEADGLSWADYRARYGEFDLVTSPTHPFSPGGESWADFLRRVRGTLERLAVRFAGQTVVAVSHAGFIVATFLVLFDIPRPGTGARVDPPHLSRTEWSVCGATWRLVRFNDA